MTSAVIESKVEHLGATYPLRLRRVPRRRSYTWQLGHADGCEGGCSMVSGNEPVPDVETAQRLALRYLERTWPYGRENPFGPGNGQE